MALSWGGSASMQAKIPWVVALREEMDLPPGVTGPVEWRALARLMAARSDTRAAAVAAGIP
jgi:hypothetical protein